MKRSLGMYTNYGISLVLLALWGGAQAQPSPSAREMPGNAAMAQERQAQRMALRSALLAQRGTVNVAYPGGRGGRELSVQERGELRQQLRQQRRVALE